MPTVSGTVTDSTGGVASWAASWTVDSAPAPVPERQIGMSSPASQWDVRLGEVGSDGITARRIFCDLTSTGRDQSTLIEWAVANGMTPVVSYKLPGNDITGALAGGYDSMVTAVKNYLQSLNVQVYATIWHEPSPDITGTQFQNLHRRYAPLLKASRIKVGPILNTWVLDNPNNYAQFDGYVADDLIADGTWEFFGYDSYQSGQRPSEGVPGNNDLSTRMATINSKIAAHGGGNLPQIIGEYNAYELDNLTAIQNTIQANDKILVACVFNSDVGSKGLVLTGSMLTSFKAFKAGSKFKQ